MKQLWERSYLATAARVAILVFLSNSVYSRHFASRRVQAFQRASKAMNRKRSSDAARVAAKKLRIKCDFIPATGERATIAFGSRPARMFVAPGAWTLELGRPQPPLARLRLALFAQVAAVSDRHARRHHPGVDIVSAGRTVGKQTAVPVALRHPARDDVLPISARS